MGRSSLREGQKEASDAFKTHTQLHGKFMRAYEHYSSPAESKSKMQKVGREKLIEKLRLSSHTEENLSLS